MSKSRFQALFCIFLGFAGLSEAQEAQKDFTFKRIKVENRPIGSKINIQIDPSEAEQAAKPEETSIAPETKPAPKDQQDWFWDVISPNIEDGSAARMGEAMGHMANAPSGKFRADAELLAKLSDEFGTDILRASIGTKVSPAFVLAVIGVESAGKPDAVSSAGAQGLMQLIPDTAKRFGVEDVNDPFQNIKGGTAYLDWLLKEFKGDPLLALAGYNAGENAVKSNSGVPPYAETRTYIPKVVAAWQIARSLCATPPEYISDGCVFKKQSVN